MTLEQINAQDCDQALIHCLPDEILELIFLINTSKLVKKRNENHPYDPHSTTLATTQVCQRWRAVALDYPVIWSRIINYERHSPLWIETLLARSGSTLIDVGGDSAFEPAKLYYPRGKPVLKSIFQRIASLKTFNACFRHYSSEYCRSFLEHPAPNLEFLNLITCRPYAHCLYLDPLFADEAPCLQRLHLERSIIDFSSSVLYNLTELSVRYIIPTVYLSVENSHRWRLAPSVAGWLQVLKNIPALRFLTLWNAISPFTEHEPLPVVDLPHLTLLTIFTVSNPGILLIDRLNIHPLCGIDFRVSRNHSISTVGPNLLFFLSKQLSHWPQDCSDRFLQAKIHKRGNIDFGNSKLLGQVPYMSGSDQVEAHSRYSKDPMLSLMVTFNNLEDSLTFFNQLLEVYSSTFSTTTTLVLWVDQRFADTAIANGSFPAFSTFRSFTNLKILKLRGQTPLFLLPLFELSSQPDQPLFPVLQSLHLAGTDIDDKEGAMCRVFVAFLQRRVEAGIPLAEIKILGRISNEAAEDLSRIGNLRVSLD